MFSTTHDVLLLLFAAAYALTSLIRTTLIASLPARQRPSHWNITIPAWIAIILVIVAVLW